MLQKNYKQKTTKSKNMLRKECYPLAIVKTECCWSSRSNLSCCRSRLNPSNISLSCAQTRQKKVKCSLWRKCTLVVNSPVSADSEWVMQQFTLILPAVIISLSTLWVSYWYESITLAMLNWIHQFKQKCWLYDIKSW